MCVTIVNINNKFYVNTLTAKIKNTLQLLQKGHVRITVYIIVYIIVYVFLGNFE